MFKKTRIKLTVLNSCVFILLIAVLSTVIYMYVRIHMYNEVDQNIYKTLERVQKTGIGIGGNMHGGDIRLRVLVWDPNNELKTEVDGPDAYIYEDNEAEFVPKHFNTMENIKVEDHYFRTFAVKGVMQGENVKIQFIEEIDGEVIMLQKLDHYDRRLCPGQPACGDCRLHFSGARTEAD